MSYGKSFVTSAMHPDLVRRAAAGGLIPKPNVWCYFCGYPLGIRPPGGLRGEDPLPFIFVRTHAYSPSCDLAHGFWALMQQTWELPDGTIRMTTAPERMREAVAEPHEILRLLDAFERLREAVATLHTSWIEDTAEQDEEDPAFVADCTVDHGQTLAKISWGQLGVVRLLPWKKTTRVNYSCDGSRYMVLRLGEPHSVFCTPIPYHGVDGIVRFHEVIVPRDAAPVFLGVFARCPKCRKVRQLE